jgi:hypothetical protein
VPNKSLLAVFSTALFVAESHGAEPKPEIADLKPDILKREPGSKLNSLTTNHL